MAQPSFQQPGPYGYPARFIVETFSTTGLKIRGPDKQALHYLERHDNRSQRMVLYSDAHKVKKKANGSPLVTIYTQNRNADHMTSTGFSVGGGPMIWDTKFPHASFVAEMHVPVPGGNQGVPLNSNSNDVCTAFTFSMPTTAGGLFSDEKFQWRRANTVPYETKGLSKKDGSMRTGDKRPKVGFFSVGQAGFVLVRLTGPRIDPSRFPKHQQPLGWTEQGEEIVASYAPADKNRAFLWYTHFIFQFWGSGLTGQLGEAFTHLAVATAAAIWQEDVIRAEITS
jgi:hypothetical protein